MYICVHASLRSSSLRSPSAVSARPLNLATSFRLHASRIDSSFLSERTRSVFCSGSTAVISRLSSSMPADPAGIFMGLSCGSMRLSLTFWSFAPVATASARVSRDDSDSSMKISPFLFIVKVCDIEMTNRTLNVGKELCVAGTRHVMAHRRVAIPWGWH